MHFLLSVVKKQVFQLKVQDKSHATKKVKGLDSVKADAQIRTSIRDFVSTVCFF